MRILWITLSIVIGASCSKPECPEPETPPTTTNSIDLKAGLLAHYPFTGNAGDSSGSLNHGVVNGAVLTADRFSNANRAYYFDGSNDYIEIASTALKNSNYTYSAWMKLDATSLNYTILSIGGLSGTDQTLSMFNSAGITGGGYHSDLTSSGAEADYLPNTNTWYHVVSTRDNNYIKLYINGLLAATSVNFSGKQPAYGNNPVKAFIGSRNTQTQFYYGTLDDIRIYNRALSSAEILQLYSLR